MSVDPRIGTELAGYRIQQVAGKGGMGVVYVAEDLRLGRRVALKLLSPELAGDDRFRRRFVRESRLAASIEHPHIVPIYAAGEVDGALFIAMRYIDGADLRNLLAEMGPLEIRRVVGIARQLADALDAAHRRGLVHRDVKPGNVLVETQGDRDHCYLTDFGLVKHSSSHSGVTGSGQLVGTVNYLAPEQIEGKPADGRSDEYSLGCLVFECLTGSPPFVRDADAATLWAHLSDARPRSSETRPQVPTAMDDAVVQAMAKAPVDRFASCDAFATAMENALPSEGVPAPRAKRGHVLAVAGIVTVGLLGTLIATSLFGSRGGTASAVAPENTLVEIDPTTNEIVGDPIPLAAGPQYITTSGQSVWVASARSKTLERIDAGTRAVVGSIRLDATPTGLAAGEFGTVWVAEGMAGRLVQIDPRSNAVHTTITVSGCCPGPMTVADAGNGALWVANPGGLRRVDPALTSQPSPTPDTGSAAIVSDAAGDAWVANGWNRVSQFAQGASVVRVASVPVGDAPSGLALEGGYLWVTTTLGDTLNRVDISSNKVVATIPVGSGAGPIAATSSAVWVANPASGTIVRVDPSTNTTTRTLEIGHRVTSIASGAGGVWVAVGAESAAKTASGSLVFDDRHHIQVVDADGSGRTQLTFGDVQDTDPDWSPDGRQIAFARSPAGHPYRRAHLYVMNADGSALHQVTEGTVVDLNPDWSPDGRRIVFLCSRPRTEAGDICVIDVDGTNRIDLTPHAEDQGRPAWSRDGTQIAFRCQNSLCAVNPDGSHMMTIVRPSDGGADAPQWAPDGVRVSFGASERGLAAGIYLTDRTGSGSLRIAVATTASTETLGATTWSPDGDRIAFGGHFDFRGDLFVMYADGSGLTRLTHDGGAGAPDWQPYR
jgi:predicted Ser/Thr protein kinase